MDFLRVYLSDERLSFYKKLAKIACSFNPRTVIDVGCGSGHFLLQMSRQSSCQLYGSEITQSGTKYASKLVPRAQIKQCIDRYGLKGISREDIQSGELSSSFGASARPQTSHG